VFLKKREFHTAKLGKVRNGIRAHLYHKPYEKAFSLFALAEQHQDSFGAFGSRLERFL